ncbi:MAG: DUF362 domain-containing protein [Candidatus Aminicenantales bacterium]
MKEKGFQSKELITRRDFLRGAALGTLGVVLYGRSDREFPGQLPSKSLQFGVGDPQSTVVLIRHEKAVGEGDRVDGEIVSEMIDTALTEFSGEKDPLKAWARFVRPEDTVGIKFTRCGWMRVHTEQAVIDTVVQRVEKAGVAKERIFAQDGGLPVARCTALINVPSVKVHTLTGIAVALKNYINFTAQPSQYHGVESGKLGEIFLRPEVKGKTRLIIVDMLRPYFGPGPQINPLHRWNYGGILVATDPVAVDTVCLKICQVKRNLFKGEEWPISPPPESIYRADKNYGLGTSDPARIKLVQLGWDKDRLI